MKNTYSTAACNFAPFQDLRAAHSTLPPYPVNALPATARDMVNAVAAHTQTPPDMAGTIGLGVLAACLQGKYVVEGSPGYTEPVNLYVAIVAQPGERKSAVMRLMACPLLDYELGCNAAPQAQHRRLIADDCTSEALTRLLAANDGRLVVLSAEGGIFDIMGGRYSTRPNIDVWLKAHCGDLIRVDRIGRDPEYIPQPTLSAILAVQPSILADIMANPTMTGRGLIARFLYALPPSGIGHRTFIAPAIPAEIATAYTSTINKLLSEPPSAPHILRLTDDATSLISTHFDAHERYMAGPGQYMADWAGKYIGAVLRIAGLFHAAEFPDSCYITGSTMANAIQLGQYYLSHAAYAYTTASSDTLVQKAMFVWSKIAQFDTCEVKRSELYQACRGRYFKRAEDLSSVLELLENHGYIRTYTPPHNGAGRPPDVRIQKNPHAQ